MNEIYSTFQSFIKENRDKSNFLELTDEFIYELSRDLFKNSKDEKQQETEKLCNTLCDVIKQEDLNNKNTLTYILNALIKATFIEDEDRLIKTISKKEALEKEIKIQKDGIKKEILNSFESIEKSILDKDEEIKALFERVLSDIKLKSIELFGILKETTQEAILTAIEKSDDLENTIFEITKNITYQAVKEGKLTQNRIINISNTIIEASVEIADEDQAFAKEIVYGSTHGVKEGISKSIEKFRNELKNTPQEVKEEFRELEEIRQELLVMDQRFIEVLRENAFKSKGISKSILQEIIKEYSNTFAKLKRISNETRETISERFNESLIFEKEIAAKATEEAKKLSSEAKKLGFHAWDIAKSAIDGAIKGAKEAIKKDKN